MSYNLGLGHTIKQAPDHCRRSGSNGFLLGLPGDYSDNTHAAAMKACRGCPDLGSHATGLAPNTDGQYAARKSPSTIIQGTNASITEVERDSVCFYQGFHRNLCSTLIIPQALAHTDVPTPTWYLYLSKARPGPRPDLAQH